VKKQILADFHVVTAYLVH
jgi:hypothetical protein